MSYLEPLEVQRSLSIRSPLAGRHRIRSAHVRADDLAAGQMRAEEGFGLLGDVCARADEAAQDCAGPLAQGLIRVSGGVGNGRGDATEARMIAEVVGHERVVGDEGPEIVLISVGTLDRCA